MRISVLIPTHGRPERLEQALRALATQSWIPGDEVVVGFDGPDPRAEALAHEAFAGARPERTGVRLRLEAMPRIGYIAVRHRLVPTLAGDAIVSLNDDVVPIAGFIAAHRAALTAAGDRAAFVGFSPFARVPSPSVIDRVVAQSSWLFFYDRMLAEPDRRRDWGFRHLFGLNFSARLDIVRRVGGFTDMPAVYGYDDIELGHRLVAAGLAVRFLPGAVALHHHRMTAEQLLAREHALGVAAAHYARVRPSFARDVFGKDILEAASLDRLRGVRVDAEMHGEFCALDREPGGSDPALPSRVLERFRPLKRACWAAGVVEAAEAAGRHSSAA
ncbi:MAG: glycosyltransferase family 2 protein [Phycisphaerales bacterium]